MQSLMGKFVSKALSVAADFGFADALAAGPLDAATIAARSRTSPDATYRVLRALAAVGIFAQTGPRTFANNPVSEALRTDVPGSLRAMARWINCPTGWEPWGRLDHSVATGQPATQILFGEDVFAVLHGERAGDGAIFNEAMTSFSAVTAGAVAEGYDFSEVSRIVDVGGGHGGLLAGILGHYPRLRAVLFDLPSVVAGATVLLERAGVADRVERVGGSFLEEVPTGADCYIMKHIIHDWDDERSRIILSNCRKGLTAGGRVLVVENVITDGPESTMGKLLDLEMLVMTPGGRERTAAEFGALFESAGLRLRRVVPTKSPVCVVEAVAA
jgi:hypothetical protein